MPKERNRSGFDALIREVGECELCGRRRNLQVHHIIPLVADIPGVDLNQESNLIVVCSRCHSALTPKNILTQIGVQRAVREGKQIGQKKGAKLTTKKSLKAKEVILKHSKDFNGTLSDQECLKLAGVARNSYYRYKRQLRTGV